MLKIEVRPGETSLTGNFVVTFELVHSHQIGLGAGFNDFGESVVGAQNGHEILLQSAVIAGVAIQGDARESLVFDVTPRHRIGGTCDDKMKT